MPRPRRAPPDNLQLDQQLCFALYRATHAMTRSYKRALAAVGLTYPQYLVMLVLWQLDGARISDVAHALDLDIATLTPLVKRLETAGWVARKRVPGDDRASSLTVSPAGWAIQPQVAGIQTAVACSTGLDAVEFERLKAALLELASRMSPPTSADR